MCVNMLCAYVCACMFGACEFVCVCLSVHRVDIIIAMSNASHAIATRWH